jgi:thiol-disulfide isomerase/thioredoxin
MSDILPEPQKSDTPKVPNLWKLGLLGAVIALGLLFVAFKAIPNLVGGADFSRFKVGTLSSLEVLKDPPTQPQNPFIGPLERPTKLADFEGKVVLVNLWATWCAPCVTEMPMLAQLQNQFDKSEFEVVAVSVDRSEAAPEAKARLSELSNGQLAFYHDPKMSIVFPLKARGFPTSILYNRDGVEIARLAGEADWAKPEAHALIEAAIAVKSE